MLSELVFSTLSFATPACALVDNRWLSSSKIAAKVKSAASTKDLVAKKMYKQMLQKSEIKDQTVQTITADDLMAGGRNAFGEPVSQQEATEIINECVDHATKRTEDDSILISEAVFESWWKSDMHHATRLREKRRSDMMMAREIVESFDTAKIKEEDYKAHRHAQLDTAELEEMIRVLKLGTSVQAILDSIASALNQSRDEVMADGVVDFTEFFDWLQSDNGLAIRVKRAFVLKDEKDKKERPFPFIPWFSVRCRNIVYSWRFEGIMTAVILANTFVMAMAHHEQDITSPHLAAFMTTADLVFSIIYVVEFLLKLFGMGAVQYFADNGNKFDFVCSAAFVAGLFIPDLTGASSFRSLRVLVKSMRVARSAKMLLRQENVQVLLKTMLDNGGKLTLLGMFAVFMLIVFSIIGGHTLGNCHVREDGTFPTDEELDQLPPQNLFTFATSFHANFLIMLGEDWSEIMFSYTECSRGAWVYFVICSCVMNYFM